jgi:hypothetical protein
LIKFTMSGSPDCFFQFSVGSQFKCQGDAWTVAMSLAKDTATATARTDAMTRWHDDTNTDTHTHTHTETETERQAPTLRPRP